MRCKPRIPFLLTVLLLPGLLLPLTSRAQPSRQRTRQFAPGALQRLEDLPTGRFRTQTDGLRPAARQRALDWLNQFHFTEIDLDALHVDNDGGVFYVDEGTSDPVVANADTPVIAEAAVPVAPFPSSLIFHSRPGAPNVLYLNFTGENVTGTAWNTSLSRTTIPAVPFSTDADFTTFSDAEQVAIKRVWQRVAEDYAPFNVDVTTERPATFTTRTAHALITRNTDTNGAANPSSTAGGVAYVGVFAGSGYATYRPAWIYYNNLSSTESYIAEAVSHELGHNMGLSHDAKTDGTSYYNGHGSGDISWGPIMGTGYNRNVSQWSKGEYYLANNTEDDLAIIAGKLTYRADDHGNTRATATALTLTGTNILSTTPETDPDNTNTVNKGVLEQRSDVDVFSFSTGSGPISLAVKPWLEAGGTRGGNLDVLLELYSESGALLLTNNVATKTDATIATNLPEGLYYLYVRNTGTGNPLSSSPTGYTDYASLGQYFVSGYVITNNYNPVPQAELQITDVNQAGIGAKQFTVTYTDNVAVDVATLDNNDLRVTGPNGFDSAAQFISVDNSANGTPRVATYSVAPPGGGNWLATDNGVYTIWIETNQVGDTQGSFAFAQAIGIFSVGVPSVLFTDNFDVNLGWTLQAQWQFGVPGYTSGNGPTSGVTGTNIIGYNLSGNYPNNLAKSYAISPAINCANASNLSLRFARWLVLKSGDTASIEVTTNGSTWTTVWSTTAATTDTAWQTVEYALPATIANSPTVQFRWGLSSGASLNDIGWNFDDFQILGVGPAASLTVQFVLDATANNAAWGRVTPTGGTYLADTAVAVTATPNSYYRFVNWTGDASGTNNPLTVQLNTNKSVQAVFAEIFTSNFPTPYWWLASYGYQQNQELVVSFIGANGMPLWQSYVAGLNPNDPNSQLLLNAGTTGDGATAVLNWNPVAGRVYTIWSSSDPSTGFTPLPGAIDLPATVNSLTNTFNAGGATFYRLEVRLP